MSKPDLVECTICKESYQRQHGHLKRHLVNVHQMSETAANEYTARCRSVSSEAKKKVVVRTPRRTKSACTGRDGVTNSNCTTYTTGNLNAHMALVIPVVVQDLLKQLDNYNMDELIEFILRKYPEIPPEVIPYVVKAAVEAAWYVSKVHHVINCYEASSDSRNKIMVETSKQNMLGWFVGFRPDKNIKASDQVLDETPVRTQSIARYSPTRPSLTDTHHNEMVYSPTLPEMESVEISDFFRVINVDNFPVTRNESDVHLTQDLQEVWPTLSFGDPLVIHEKSEDLHKAVNQIVDEDKLIENLVKNVKTTTTVTMEPKPVVSKVVSDNSTNENVLPDPTMKRVYNKTRVATSKPKVNKVESKVAKELGGEETQTEREVKKKENKENKSRPKPKAGRKENGESKTSPLKLINSLLNEQLKSSDKKQSIEAVRIHSKVPVEEAVKKPVGKKVEVKNVNDDKTLKAVRTQSIEEAVKKPVGKEVEVKNVNEDKLAKVSKVSLDNMKLDSQDKRASKQPRTVTLSPNQPVVSIKRMKFIDSTVEPDTDDEEVGQEEVSKRSCKKRPLSNLLEPVVLLSDSESSDGFSEEVKEKTLQRVNETLKQMDDRVQRFRTSVSSTTNKELSTRSEQGEPSTNPEQKEQSSRPEQSEPPAKLQQREYATRTELKSVVNRPTDVRSRYQHSPRFNFFTRSPYQRKWNSHYIRRSPMTSHYRRY